MSAPATLAIGLCTYNRGPKITRTLQAIAALDRAGARLARTVIIDNNCTDDTPAIVDAFIAAHPDIAMSRIREPKQGLSEARRRVFESTTEDLVAFLDDDCLPRPDWAAQLIRLFDDQPRAGAAGSRIDLEWESGPTPIADKYRAILAHQDLGPSRARIDDPETTLAGAALVMRRRAVEESGWLTRRRLSDRSGGALTSGGDTELCILIRRAGWELWHEPTAITGHLIPPERQTLAYLTRLRETIALNEPLVKWMAHNEPGLDWARALESRARRHYLKTLLLEWRPTRRAMRLAERRGRLAGWRNLIQMLSSR